MSRRALLWLAGLALVVGALLLTDLEPAYRGRASLRG
jgi:hypothetical protein